MDKPTIHTGAMLSAHIKKHRYFIAALARDTQRNPKTIHDNLKRQSVQTDLLLDISMGLRYNFFQELASWLPPDFPPHFDTAKDTRIRELEEEVKLLKNTVENLKESLRLVSGR